MEEKNITVRDFERGCRPEDVDCNSSVDIRKCCCKLNVYDWIGNINDPLNDNTYVEVRFKNTRKGIFENSNLDLKVGDVVAVEANPGHDIGIVSAVGRIARMQMHKYKMKEPTFKKVYRKARPTDIQKWKEAISLEIPTMLRTRELARELNLNMKIGDVEFQGDKTKAIFYYIADERVDFRELIKRMAEEFRIRVEMKQIGARQEAGRIGGIGPCGRELCCTTWMIDFVSVSTNSARLQELSLNPQKLAGQCSKLKCCLNYELGVYLHERKNFPDNVSIIKTKTGEAYHTKNDIFKGLMYFETKINEVTVIRALEIQKVKEIIELNAKGIYPDDVFVEEKNTGKFSLKQSADLNQDSLTRFQDTQNTGKKKKKKKKKKNNPGNQN